MQEWLRAHQQLDSARTVSSNSSGFSSPPPPPAGERFENLKTCHLLFARVQHAVSQQSVTNSSLRGWSSLLRNAAMFPYHQGNTSESRRMAETSVSTRERVLGPESSDTIKSYEREAWICIYPRQCLAYAQIIAPGSVSVFLGIP